MTKAYRNLTAEERKQEYAQVLSQFEAAKAKGLKLDMSRGKPGARQLDMISDLAWILQKPEDFYDGGTDVRNYGVLSGLPSAKALFAEILGTRPEEVFVGGNSSLNLMYDVIAKAYTHGLLHSEKPWSQLETVKFLCPVPGYDRHFAISQSFGMEMIAVPMDENGPDMTLVKTLVKDPAVKGMWCVPKYSNPTGILYSSQVIDRIAHLQPAAPDFVLMWDNAYCVHEFDGEYVPFPDILSLCREAGNPDMVFEFASTSKITMPGAGVAVFATSPANMAYMTGLMTFQTISYDKVNQLRHVRYLKNKAHTLALMKRHGEILKPRFDAVTAILQRELGDLAFASWTQPKGGYFISLDTMEGTAKRALALCKEAGVVMTGAGATFPYGIDPLDQNIRIAPSMPPVEELEQAMEIFCLCLRLAALEKLGQGA